MNFVINMEHSNNYSKELKYRLNFELSLIRKEISYLNEKLKNNENENKSIIQKLNQLRTDENNKLKDLSKIKN